MRITRTADYGVRVMTRLAAAPAGTRMTVAELAHDSQSTVAFTGKILLFKSINIRSTEVYSDFRPVPVDLTFAQGVQLLKKQVTTVAQNQPQNGSGK